MSTPTPRTGCVCLRVPRRKLISGGGGTLVPLRMKAGLEYTKGLDRLLLLAGRFTNYFVTIDFEITELFTKGECTLRLVLEVALKKSEDLSPRNKHKNRHKMQYKRRLLGKFSMDKNFKRKIKIQIIYLVDTKLH